MPWAGNDDTLFTVLALVFTVNLGLRHCFSMCESLAVGSHGPIARGRGAKKRLQAIIQERAWSSRIGIRRIGIHLIGIHLIVIRLISRHLISRRLCRPCQRRPRYRKRQRSKLSNGPRSLARGRCGPNQLTIGARRPPRPNLSVGCEGLNRYRFVRAPRLRREHARSV
jgi:hypothetical protein